MRGKTLAEKILSEHAHESVWAGDIAVCDIDLLMIPDSYGMFTVKSFREMGGTEPFDPDKVMFIIGSNFPAPNDRIANLHKYQRDFALEKGVTLVEGQGLCHQIVREHRSIEPGQLIIGGDSHTCIFGAWGAYGSGMGGTDLAAAMLSGKTWFSVPQSIKITLNGKLPKNCCAKDIILTLIGKLGVSGADNMSVELYGKYFDDCPLAARMTIASMAVDMGADTCFLVRSDHKVRADEDAVYAAEYTFDLSEFVPCVAKPHSMDNWASAKSVRGAKIDAGVIGSCTNGSLTDLQDAADILRGKHIAKGCRLMVVPSSNKILLEAQEKGIIRDLLEAGASIFTPSCGCCSGKHAGIPADGETVISSTPRNGKGRMGNVNASIYLAGPKVIAASCLKGYIDVPVCEA